MENVATMTGGEKQCSVAPLPRRQKRRISTTAFYATASPLRTTLMDSFPG